MTEGTCSGWRQSNWLISCVPSAVMSYKNTSAYTLSSTLTTSVAVLPNTMREPLTETCGTLESPLDEPVRAELRLMHEVRLSSSERAKTSLLGSVSSGSSVTERLEKTTVYKRKETKEERRRD